MDEKSTIFEAMKKCEGFFNFTLNEENRMTASYSKRWDEIPPEDFYIPEQHEGKKVEVLNLDWYLPENTTTLYIPRTINEIQLVDGNFAPSLKKIIVSDENESYWSDGYALYTKDKTKLLRLFNTFLEEYYVAEGTKVLGEKAFLNCYVLKKIVLPDTVVELEKGVFGAGYREGVELVDREVIGIENTHFSDISAVYQTTYYRDNPNLTSGKTLVLCRKLDNAKYVVPEGIEEIGRDCFSRREGEDQNTLVEIVMPDTVRRIGNNAFKGNIKLNAVRLSGNLENIPDGAFDHCDSLEKLYVPASVSDFSLFSLPENNKTYKASPSAFKEIVIAEDNPYYCSIDGILYSKDHKKLLFVPRDLDIKTFRVPDGVEHIEDYAFSYQHYLEEIVLPGSVVSIGEYAFSSCLSLRSVQLINVQKINNGAFSECSRLERVELSDSLRIISDWAFRECQSLRQITLPEGVEVIGGDAFSKTSLQTVRIPKSVKTAGYGSFDSCDEITIYDSIDPFAGDCNASVDTVNGRPNSQAGCVGLYSFGGRFRLNWHNHVMTVRSTATDEILFKILMYCESDQRWYANLLSSAWGHNATFAFPALDKSFTKISGYKPQVAMLRLRYPVDLSEEAASNYKKYITKVAKDAVRFCIDSDDMEMLNLCREIGAIKPNSLPELIEYANSKGKVDFSAWLLDFQNANPVKTKKKSALSLNEELKPKKTKTVDKTSDTYMKKVWSVSEQYNGKFYITSYKGEDTDIVFPTEVAGKKIFGIASRRSAPAIYPLLTSVIIPEGYEEIGGSAFADCKALKSISIPQSVEKIGDNAFSGCVSLEKIVIPEKTWIIGKWALRDCTALKDIYILNRYLSFEGKAVLRGCGNYIVHAPAGAAVERSVKGKHFAALSPNDTKAFAQNVFSEPVKEMMLWIEPMDEESLAQIKANLGEGSEEFLQSLIANHGDGYVPCVGDKVHFEGVNACIGNHGPCGEPTVHAREIELYWENLEGTVISEIRNLNEDGHTKVFDVKIRLKDSM